MDEAMKVFLNWIWISISPRQPYLQLLYMIRLSILTSLSTPPWQTWLLPWRTKQKGQWIRIREYRWIMNTVHFTHGDPQETKVFLHRHLGSHFSLFARVINLRIRTPLISWFVILTRSLARVRRRTAYPHFFITISHEDFMWRKWNWTKAYIHSFLSRVDMATNAFLASSIPS